MDLKNDPAIQGHDGKMESMCIAVLYVSQRGAGTSQQLSMLVLLLDSCILIYFYMKRSTHNLLEIREK